MKQELKVLKVANGYMVTDVSFHRDPASAPATETHVFSSWPLAVKWMEHYFNQKAVKLPDHG